MATTNQSVTAPHILRRQQGQIPEKTWGIPLEQYSEKHPKEQFGAEQFKDNGKCGEERQIFCPENHQKTTLNMTGQTSASPTARHQACHHPESEFRPSAPPNCGS